jgi:hypothetical protein
MGGCSVADPGSGAFFTPRSGIEKNPDPESKMNIPDSFSKSLEIVFRIKIHKFFDANPDPKSL